SGVPITEYMSPEQAQGLPTDGPPTDIYALGVVLYELLTGTFPFHAETPMAMLAARLLQSPIPPRDVRSDLPPSVEDVIMRALARKPEARFASSAEMVAALRSAAEIGSTTQAQPPLTPGSGTPAIGETIVTGTAGPRTPVYVQPQIPTPPPQPRAGIPPTNPVLSPSPTISISPVAGAASSPKKPKTGVLIGMGAAVILLIAAVMGGIALTRTPGPTPTTGPAATDPAIAGLLSESDAALAEGKIDEAIKGYNDILAQSPNNTAALSGLALADNLRGDWASAEESANALVNAALSDDTAAALGLTLLADALISQGNTSEAEQTIAQASDLHQKLALTHAIQSTITASQASDLGDTTLMDQALSEADKAVDNLADEIPVIQALTYNAIAVTFSQDYDVSGNEHSRTESEADYQHAIDLMPDIAIFHSNLGYLYNSAKQYDTAREMFQKALDIDPSYALAQVGIGWSYYAEDQNDKATSAFEDAVTLAPHDPSAYFALGRLAFDREDYDTAISEFQNAAQRANHSALFQAWIGKAYQFSGFITSDTTKQKQLYDNAETAYRKALEFNPSSAFAASGLGWVLQYQERYQDSVSAFEHALELKEENDESHNGLGWSLFNLNRYNDAERHFLQAIELAPNYISPRYGLARTLEKLGHTDEARTEYQNILTIDPSYTDAQDALNQLGR
ncbi:MAG: tetratricopeptide repeat protein, partial [Oscillochloris sp.]|nr:tetratricopeptide repeat protein [Oscillochloris sp.]